MTLSIRTVPGRPPNLRRILDDGLEAVPPALGAASVVAVEGSSEWPVDTGESKAGFRYETEGEMVRLVNDAPYAGIVEARTGAAARAIEGDETAILKSADDALQKALDRSRRSGGLLRG